MAHVYADISGEANRPVLVAAGYLGHDGEWDRATAAWQEILRDAGVSHFHATDFFNCRKQFKSWTLNEARHVEFAKRFTAVADDAGLVGFAHAIDCEAFVSILAPEVEKENRKHRSTNPRTQAMMGMLAQVNAFLAKTTYRQQHGVPVTIEHEEGAGRFNNFFNESKERTERWSWWFGEMTTADKGCIPLQIADLLAHETWRRASSVATNPDATVRQSFQRMLEKERIELRFLTRADAVTNAEKVRDVLARYPNGLQPADAKA